MTHQKKGGERKERKKKNLEDKGGERSEILQGER